MIRVTVLDEATGDEEVMRIGDGPEGYVVTCGPGCEVVGSQRYKNGTVMLTIKPTREPIETPRTARKEGQHDRGEG